MIFKILFWGGGSIQQLENGQKFKIEIDVFFVLVLGQERRITHTRMSFTKSLGQQIIKCTETFPLVDTHRHC